MGKVKRLTRSPLEKSSSCQPEITCDFLDAHAFRQAIDSRCTIWAAPYDFHTTDDNGNTCTQAGREIRVTWQFERSNIFWSKRHPKKVVAAPLWWKNIFTDIFTLFPWFTNQRGRTPHPTSLLIIRHEAPSCLFSCTLVDHGLGCSRAALASVQAWFLYVIIGDGKHLHSKKNCINFRILLSLVVTVYFMQ